MEYNRLKGLSFEDYQYPGEKQLFEAVRKVPFIDQIVAAYLKYLTEMSALPEIQGNCFRITKDTCPEIYKLYLTALERLDMPDEYPLYARSDFEYNAFAFGGGSPFIGIHSSLINDLTDEELLGVIGHELGHIKSGHAVYNMMAGMIGTVITSLKIPGVDFIAIGLELALMRWKRAHEYTADRAGAIASGGTAPSVTLLGKLLGTGREIPLVKIQQEDLFSQKTAFDEANNDIITKLLNLLMISGMQHPFTVSRIQALREWEESGQFSQMVNKFI